jgi:hypothetical protein
VRNLWQRFRETWKKLYFFPFWGGGAASALHMAPVSPQALHFLGLQRVSTLLPHFSQVKTAMSSASGIKKFSIDAPDQALFMIAKN